MYFVLFRALTGLIVSVIAMISGWGLTMYVGSHPWQATNLASVFLLLGVGIDDTFVMLSAWKRIQGNLLRVSDNKTVKDREFQYFGQFFW